MPTQFLKRRDTTFPALSGKPHAVPIYVDSDDSIIKFIPAGSGTTEVQVVDTATDQTITGAKTFTGDCTFTKEITTLETFADGTAAAPSISFASDTNSGIYWIGADNIGIALGGAIEWNLSTTALSPGASNGSALGTTALMWADLFLATGGVIDWNNGEVTLTESATGPTLSLGAARLTLDFASTTQTDGSVLRMGTSGAPLVDDQAGAGFVVGYFDCGATSGWPGGLFINTNVTGVGGSFTALQGDAVVTAAKAVVTGIESFLQFATPGKVTGAARACQATIDFGNYTITTGGGVYSAACFNVKGEGSSCDPSAAQRMSCLELKTEGTFKTNCDFEKAAAGYAIYFNGFTAASGVTNIVSSTPLAELTAVNPIGIRIGVGADGASGAAYYLIAVPAADWN